MHANTHRLHWSYSSLRQLQTCPLQFKLQRIDGLQPSHRNPALVLGGVYHVVLAEALNLLVEKKQPTVKSITECFETIWSAEVGIEEPPVLWTKRTTEKSLRRLGRKMVAAWIEQGLPIFLGAKKILGIEVPFQVPLINSAGEVLDMPLEGFIDVVMAAADGTTQVVDHKTASQAFGAAQLEMDLQPSCYVYAAHHMGYGNARFAFHSMSKAKKGPVMEIIDVQRTHPDFDRLFWVASQCEKLVDSGIFLPRAPGWSCDGCEYRHGCRSAHVKSHGREA